MSQAILPRSGVARPPLAVLVMMAAISPLAINLFVPSVPSIAADLQAPYAKIQLGLSLYLVFMAIMQLVTGPISDRLGRRPVALASLVIFVIGSVMCAVAPNADMFLAGRIVQTTSAIGLMLSRTIVRDVYPRDKSASMIGYVVMAMAVAPMVGPAIGGLIDQLAGWRAVFVLLAACGAVTLAANWLMLPETNASRGQSVRDQMRAWRGLAGMSAFWLYTMSAGLTAMVFFGFLGGGPAVATGALGLSPFQYGLWFALCAFGYAIGNFLSGRYSQRRGIETMMRDGAATTLSGPVIVLILFAAGLDHPASLFVPLILLGIGNGMVLPNSVAAVISLKPEAAGAASGLLGALQIGLGAIGSVIGALAAGDGSSAIGLAIFLCIVSLGGLVGTLLAIRSPRPIEV
ncbi:MULTISPECIES: multidrug effflux MFS transporter [unclassified Roseitalea]|uniref:multidrug effflux MFS transporter n=1 Tax=unclassified Roseitalea TaxID=2639107 RepID=UPI00274018D3|nr:MULTISPECIES: multidrug effflux MFS transporter [unclassified Roseitalea]